MKFVPKSLSRLTHSSLLKLSANSPTILVVAGVVGLGATAVLAAKATRNIDPVLDEHKQARASIGYVGNSRAQQRDIIRLYTETGMRLTRVYGPTLAVGTLSAASILYGHKILRGRHMASLAAYTGLMEQFQSYRGRVAKTLGNEMEKSLYDGAHGEWAEDPEHKGEYKLEAKFDPDAQSDSYLRPFFDENNVHWTKDPVANYLFLKGVQSHMNNVLQIRGHVFLNDVYDALRIPRTNEGQVAGWVWNSKTGDNYIDFGFMTGREPQTEMFRQGLERSVRLNFNIDGNVLGLI